MKNKLKWCAALLLFIGCMQSVHAQEKGGSATLKLITDIYLDIDKTVLESKNGMFYYTESNKDVFMVAFIAPQSYDVAKEKRLNDENEKYNVTIQSEKELNMNGVKYMVQEGVSNKEGVEFHVYSYLVEYKDEQSFFLMGMSRYGDPVHVATFEKAAVSFINKKGKK